MQPSPIGQGLLADSLIRSLRISFRDLGLVVFLGGASAGWSRLVPRLCSEALRSEPLGSEILASASLAPGPRGAGGRLSDTLGSEILGSDSLGLDSLSREVLVVRYPFLGSSCLLMRCMMVTAASWAELYLPAGSLPPAHRWAWVAGVVMCGMGHTAQELGASLGT